MPAVLTDRDALTALVESSPSITWAAEQIGVARETLLRYMGKARVQALVLPGRVKVVDIGDEIGPLPTPGTVSQQRYLDIKQIFDEWGIEHLLEFGEMCPKDCPRGLGGGDELDGCLCDDRPCIYERRQSD